MHMRQTQHRRLPAAVCTQAVQVGCPHASQHSAARSRWLRSTCALACRCNARFGEWLVLFGSAGIVGFCAAVVGFRAGVVSEAHYLAGVAGSLSMFLGSVLITHLGDPHELKRSECQQAFGARPQAHEPAEVLSISVTRTVSRSVTGAVVESISRARTTAPLN
jgi:hypothetical protein